MNTSSLLFRIFCLIFWFFLTITTVLAHPMPSSNVNLKIGTSSIQVEAMIPLTELESALGHAISDIHDPSLERYMIDHIHATSTGDTWQTSIQSIEKSDTTDPIVGSYEGVRVLGTLTPSTQTHLRDFVFSYDAVIHQVITHRAIVSVSEDWLGGVHAEGSPTQVGVIEVDTRTNTLAPLTVRLDSGSIWRGLLGMVEMGMIHIRDGYDHILFLLTLLIIAPLTIVNKKWSLGQGMRYTIRRFLQISLAFTIGHSISLFVGAWGITLISGKYIEILIAVTILLSAINALVPIWRWREVSIALGFGLIHGMAFWTSLASLDLSTPLRLLSILAFNIGIELMQLIVMFGFFPVLLLSRYPSYRIVRIVFALVALVLAGLWMWERVSGQSGISDMIGSMVG